MDAKDNPSDIPKVVAPPPLIYILPLILGLLVYWAIPISFLPTGLQLVFGLPIVAIGVLSFLWSGLTLHRAGTDTAFRKPTKVIVAEGPYRFSRNPIYLSVALIYLGVVISFNALWPLLLFPIVIIVIQRGVIEREEQYLERRFGEDYLRYKSKIRRWI